jgi:peptidoglycan/LPS O-acetylase OafA/YrhL
MAANLPVGQQYALAKTLLYGGGDIAVLFFIVLSGYCLMLGVQSEWDKDTDGFGGSVIPFLARRAFRILPVYYLALATFLALQVLHVCMTRGSITPAWTTRQFAMGHHLLLTYDLVSNPNTRKLLDPPMWSLAIEWHLYFAFPIVIWIWRKFGFAWALLGTYALFSVINSQFMVDPHYMVYPTAFVGGSAACMVVSARTGIWSHLRNRVPWFAILVVMVFALNCIRDQSMVGGYNAYIDLFTGTAVFGPLLVSVGINPLMREAAASPPLAFLGQISYPLYLLHMLPIGLWFNFVEPHIMPYRSEFTFPVLTIASVGLSIFLAWVVHVLVEAPLIAIGRKCFDRTGPAGTAPTLAQR